MNLRLHKPGNQLPNHLPPAATDVLVNKLEVQALMPSRFPRPSGQVSSTMYTAVAMGEAEAVAGLCINPATATTRDAGWCAPRALISMLSRGGFNPVASTTLRCPKRY